MLLCVGMSLSNALRRIRSVADYQFGRGVGTVFFPEATKIVFSRKTGRIRFVYLDGKRLATMRPTDGLFSLSINGAQRIVRNKERVECFVTVKRDVSKFIAEGGDVFAVHVVDADDVRAKDEIIVLDDEGNVLAVGRAALSAGEMMVFKRGVAVKVRRGRLEER
jgi:uncharacterized protein with predicted RNA binding PUA domain